MPRIDADGVELFYESLGEGTPLVLQGHDHTPWMLPSRVWNAAVQSFLTRHGL